MVGRDGAFGILMGAAVGTLFLVPAHGSAQDSTSVSCGNLTDRSPLEILVPCAERGFAYAQYNLALMYAGGDGVTQDAAEAARWFRLAAEQGVVYAQLALGVLHVGGLGVAQDYAEAMRWYRLAAEQGDAGSQANLGLMYHNGNGVPQDRTEAARWYRLAAEQGHAEAQYNLGGMYGNGDGVPEDLVYAYMWFNLSAAQGHETAQSYKDIVEQRMTREQIAEAQRLSREWIETHPQDGGN